MRSRHDIEFDDDIREFASATRGLIEPRPGQSHFSLSASQEAETIAAPEGQMPDRANSGAVNATFNLDACFVMVMPLDLPERVTAIASYRTRHAERRI